MLYGTPGLVLRVDAYVDQRPHLYDLLLFSVRTDAVWQRIWLKQRLLYEGPVLFEAYGWYLVDEPPDSWSELRSEFMGTDGVWQ